MRVELGQPFSTTDRCLCEACRTGAAKPVTPGEAAGSPQRSILDSTNLNLFSSQTIVLHKQRNSPGPASQERPKSTKLKLVKSGSSRAPSLQAMDPSASVAGPVRPGSTAVASTGGSANPAPSAQRIVFRCIHCKSTLSIRPVEKTSKLTCPHCTKEIFITISGRALKMSPSVVLKNGGLHAPSARRLDAPLSPEAPGAAQSAGRGSAVVVKPGSIRVVKSSSSRILKTGVAPARTPVSPAVPIPGTGPAREPQRPQSVRVPAAPSRSPSFRAPLIAIPEKQAANKPCSAFEEHQARQDPEKTVFITEEPTADLSALASEDVLRSSRRDAPGQSSGGVRATSQEGPLLPDSNDLLENDGGARTPKATGSESQPAQHKGIAQRVLKSIFLA